MRLKVMSGLVGLLLCLMMACNAAAKTVWGDLEARFSDIPCIEYEGTKYRLRSRLTTILLAGTDQRGEAEDVVDARSGGQADFLLILAIDDNNGTVTPMQLNRDTMAEITVLNVLGQPSGARTAQLCLAHSFGDGGEQSCKLLVEAVSRYLLDTPVDHYFVMGMDGIAAFNDALGGVEVTLEDDFTSFDPEMNAGKTMVLQGVQAEYYVRQRYDVGEQTNVSRQIRQQHYMQAAAEIFVDRICENPNFIDALFDSVEDFSVTDMRRGRMLNYAQAGVRYELLPMVEIHGENRLGENGFMEFHSDERSLIETVISVFYEAT